jgi:hypothetical protein
MNGQFDFPALIFVERPFQKQDFNSGLLRLDVHRVAEASQARTDAQSPLKLILSSTHQHFQEHHLYLPPGYSEELWQPSLHLSVKKYHIDDAQRQIALVTPMLLLKTIDLRDPRLPETVAALIAATAPEPYREVSIREMFAVADRTPLRKKQEGHRDRLA